MRLFSFNVKQPMDNNLDELFGLYEQYGSEEYGENVTQLQHALQAAACARKEGYDDEVILAALFHDVGHLYGDHGIAGERMDEFGVMDHEELGAQYLLRLGFSERMATLVRSHVAAKRYLTARQMGYYDKLSEASKETLRFQGGPMTEDEAVAFEQHTDFAMMIKMREWDEEAKIVGAEPGDLGVFRVMAENLLG